MTIAAAETPQQADARRRRRDLAIIALLLLADADEGVLAWNTFAPRQFRGLLNAVAFDNVRDETGDLPAFWFDRQTQRYGIGRRGFITMPAIWQAFDTFIANAGNAATASVAPVFAGGDVSQWQTTMKQQARAVAVASTTLAVGGVDLLTDEYLAVASKGLTFPLQRLERFASQIDAGIVTPEAAGRRAAMYPQAMATGEGGYEDIRRRVHKVEAFVQEQNVLSPDAEHCLPTPLTAGCAELTRLGWVDINTLPLPGLRTCKQFCKCHMAYRRTQPTEN